MNRRQFIQSVAAVVTAGLIPQSTHANQPRADHAISVAFDRHGWVTIRYLADKPEDFFKKRVPYREIEDAARIASYQAYCWNAKVIWVDCIGIGDAVYDVLEDMKSLNALRNNPYRYEMMRGRKLAKVIHLP